MPKITRKGSNAKSYAQWLADNDDDIPWDGSELEEEKAELNGETLCKDLLKRRQDESPDFLERKLEKDIPVFVYGTLKRNGYLHTVLEGTPYLGSAATVQGMWDLKVPWDGYFPIMMKSNKGAEPFLGKIRGEVYIVDPLTLLKLDRTEANGTMYQRQKISVALYEQRFKSGENQWRPHVIDCWVYVGVPEYWDRFSDMKRCPYEVIGQNKYLTFPVQEGKRFVN